MGDVERFKKLIKGVIPAYPSLLMKNAMPWT